MITVRRCHLALILGTAWTAGFGQDAALSRRDAATPPGLNLFPAAAAANREAAGEAGSGADDSALYGEQELLARPDRWKPWTLSISGGGEWQSNAALAPDGAQTDHVLRQTATARNTWKLSDAWYLDLGAAEQIVRYDEFDALDFDRLDADAGLLWITPPTWSPALANWVVSGRLSWYRLSAANHFSEELFNNTAISASLLRYLALHRHHSLLISLSGELSVEASSEDARRDEYAAFVAWQAQWSPHWETTLLGRAALYDYDRHDDWNLIGSLSLDYVLHKNCRLGLSASWTQNISDVSSFDYGNATLGATLRLQLRF